MIHEMTFIPYDTLISSLTQNHHMQSSSVQRLDRQNE